jgi:hypothetical protein
LANRPFPFLLHIVLRLCSRGLGRLPLDYRSPAQKGPGPEGRPSGGEKPESRPKGGDTFCSSVCGSVCQDVSSNYFGFAIIQTIQTIILNFF